MEGMHDKPGRWDSLNCLQSVTQSKVSHVISPTTAQLGTILPINRRQEGEGYRMATSKQYIHEI